MSIQTSFIKPFQALVAKLLFHKRERALSGSKAMAKVKNSIYSTSPSSTPASLASLQFLEYTEPFPPWGLCIGCSLAHSFSIIHRAPSLTSSGSLLKCQLLSKYMPDHSFETCNLPLIPGPMFPVPFPASFLSFSLPPIKHTACFAYLFSTFLSHKNVSSMTTGI